MESSRNRDIYQETEEGGIQLAASADRWILHEDHVNLAPYHLPDAPLLRVDAELKPFVADFSRAALVVIDMQNDFCSPGGWTDASGLNYQGCRESIPGIQRAIGIARERGMWVIWVYWHNRDDLRNLGAPTLYSFKHKPSQSGIGEQSAEGKDRVLIEGSWNAEIIDELKPLMRDEDVVIEKVRMSGFYGTHLDQVLRTQGINTLFFSGVNIDQCVSTTMQGAYFRDYNCVLLEDAASTSSPDYCKQDVVFNTKQCWGFVTDTRRLAAAEPFQG
jgi:ureidoacrylate peracid hydrolase